MLPAHLSTSINTGDEWRVVLEGNKQDYIHATIISVCIHAKYFLATIDSNTKNMRIMSHFLVVHMYIQIF